jgi:predicted nucleic acid-binding protein
LPEIRERGFVVAAKRTMKDLFPEYYRPSEEEFQRLWKECLFVLDANILLNIYGYSETTREQLLALLERLASRIRMPYQFALEYQRNRTKAIMEQVKNYANAEKVLDDLYKNELFPKHKHPYLSGEMLRAFRNIQKDLAASRKKHEALFTDDPYFTYAVYHGRFIEMLLTHFDLKFTQARASALPETGDIVEFQ